MLNNIIKAARLVCEEVHDADNQGLVWDLEDRLNAFEAHFKASKRDLN